VIGQMMTCDDSEVICELYVLMQYVLGAIDGQLGGDFGFGAAAL
jgi:hypothetical protein